MKPIALFIGAALASAILPTFGEVSRETLDNLNTAFQGESNAARRYELFAKQADSEGYPQAAHLFRAAAKAESIHRDSHKAVIQKLGGEIKKFQLDEVKPGTTVENLRAAIKGETYERDTMYPQFIEKSRQDGAREATRTLMYAKKVEAEHAKLYQATLDTLEQKKDVPIYVCQVCGYTTTQLPARRCVNCLEPVSHYIEVR